TLFAIRHCWGACFLLARCSLPLGNLCLVDGFRSLRQDHPLAAGSILGASRGEWLCSVRLRSTPAAWSPRFVVGAGRPRKCLGAAGAGPGVGSLHICFGQCAPLVRRPQSQNRRCLAVCLRRKPGTSAQLLDGKDHVWQCHLGSERVPDIPVAALRHGGGVRMASSCCRTAGVVAYADCAVACRGFRVYFV